MENNTLESKKRRLISETPKEDLLYFKKIVESCNQITSVAEEKTLDCEVIYNGNKR